MKSRIQKVLLLFCVIFLYTCAPLRAEQPELTRGKFESSFEAFANGTQVPMRLNANSRHAQENLHYVFITGFLSFQYPDYFVEQMKILEQMGVPRKNIHLLRPSSRLGVEESTNWIKRELENIPGRLVIIPHSKGGAEIFTLAMKNSTLIQERVDDIYFLQAAIGGSSLADIMLDPQFDWNQFKDFTPKEQRKIQMEKLKALFPKYFLRSGMQSLQTDYRREQVRKLLLDNPAAIELVSPKAHYITSHIEDISPYNFTERTTWKVLNALVGESDGVVQTKSQSVGEVGNVILHTEAAHGDFTNPSHSVFHASMRTALIKSIATAVETKNNPDHPLCVWTFGKLAQ